MFDCAYCHRTLDERERDDDLHGRPCCLTCGPHEDDTRRRYQPPPVSPPDHPLTFARVDYSNVDDDVRCGICGVPRRRCCC
jgi:hypothetical protein